MPEHRIEFIAKDEAGELMTLTITCSTLESPVSGFTRDLRRVLEREVEPWGGWTIQHIRDYPVKDAVRS